MPTLRTAMPAVTRNQSAHSRSAMPATVRPDGATIGSVLTLNTKGTTMSTATTRTVAKASRSNTSKPVTPFQKALRDLHATVEKSGARSKAATDALARVGTHLADDATVKASAAEVKRLSGELVSARASYDTMSGNRRRAIVAAHKEGFSYRAITAAFPVSLGNVTKVLRAERLSKASKGGVTFSEAFTAVEAKDDKAFNALLADVEKNGTLPGSDAPKGPPTTAKVSSVVSRSQSILDAARVVSWESKDRDALATAVKALGEAQRILAGHIAQIDKAAKAAAAKAA